MTKLARTASIEAIAASLGARTHGWPGRQHYRIPMPDAAMALCGADSLSTAFWLLSMGHDSAENLDACAAHLMQLAGADAVAERWADGRMEGMVSLCLEELSHGYAAESTRMTEQARADWMQMSERHWRGMWRDRYQRMMRTALDQVNAAQVAIGRRVGDV
jgi:hypothetical protein